MSKELTEIKEAAKMARANANKAKKKAEEARKVANSLREQAPPFPSGSRPAKAKGAKRIPKNLRKSGLKRNTAKPPSEVEKASLENSPAILESQDIAGKCDPCLAINKLLLDTPISGEELIACADYLEIRLTPIIKSECRKRVRAISEQNGVLLRSLGKGFERKISCLYLEIKERAGKELDRTKRVSLIRE